MTENQHVSSPSFYQQLRMNTRLWFGLRLIGWVISLIGVGYVVYSAVPAYQLLIEQAQSALEHPYNINYGEGPLLDQAVRLAQGQNIYPADLTVPPYTITNYPPLFVFAQSLFVNSLGPAFWYGRLISLVSLVICALFSGLIVWTLGRHWVGAVVTAVTLPTITYFFHWSALARIDTFALALSLVGVWFVLTFPKSRSSLFVGVLFLTASAFTRQTFLLAAPMACFAYLWGNRERYSAVILTLWVSVMVLGIFAILLVTTEGGIFFHIVTANVNTINPTIFEIYTIEVIRNFPLFLGAVVLMILLGWLIPAPKPRRKAWWFVTFYALGSIAIFTTIAKVGSDINYLYELCAAFCITAGVLIAAARKFPPLQVALMAVLVLQITASYELSAGKYAAILRERFDQRAQQDELYAELQTLNQPVLADEYMGMLVLSGRPILLQPFEMSQLAQANVWDETPFIQAMQRGEYPYILLYQPWRNMELRFERWTPAMLRMLNSQYRPLMQRAETMIYQFITR